MSAKIIVSLTSYPARIGTVAKTIETLLSQTRPADAVVLWLAPEQFPGGVADLPAELRALCGRGLTIDWYHNVRSYTKLIPALHKYPDDIIVTADDDILYAPDWLEQLVDSYNAHPNMISCHRAHRVKFCGNKIAPYGDWGWCVQYVAPSYNNFLTGVGGVIYPPHCMHRDVLDEGKFKSLAPLADDIWFWAMAVHNNIKINVINGPNWKTHCIPGTQDIETALRHTNVAGNRNDEQLAAVLAAYPAVAEKLAREPVHCSWFWRSKFTGNKDLFYICGMHVFKIKRFDTCDKYYVFGICVYRRKH